MEINIKHLAGFFATIFDYVPAICDPPDSEGMTKQEKWEKFLIAWNTLDKKNETEGVYDIK